MVVATGKSILNGIAIGKIKVYKAPVYDIYEGIVEDPAAEVERFNTAVQKAIDEQKAKKQQIISDYAQKNDLVHQLIDLALLQNGMLKGEALDRFLKRSIDLMK